MTYVAVALAAVLGFLAGIAVRGFWGVSAYVAVALAVVLILSIQAVREPL